MLKFKRLIAIALTLCVTVLTASAAAYSEIPLNTDIDAQILDKICGAIKKSGDKIFTEQYWDEEYIDRGYEVKKINFINVAAIIDGNYVISFAFDDRFVDGCGDDILGDYVVDYYECTFGVYSLSEDKLYSCKEAYENGILNNANMYNIWKTQKGKPRLENFITRLGDIDRDGNIDIIDIAKLRNSIATGNHYELYHSADTSFADMNHDEKSDILDLALMRHYVIVGDENAK